MLLVLAAPLGYAIAALVGWRWPDAVRTRKPFVLRTVAAVGAVAAVVLSDAAPTALPVVDAVYRAVFAASFTLVGARARWNTTVVVAVLTAAVATTSPLHALALVGAGAALAMALTGRRGRAGRAVVVALIALALLELRWPEPTGVTAMVSASLGTPVVVSGLRRMRPGHRRRIVGATLAGGGIAAAATVLAALSVLSARGPLESGLSHSQRGLDEARNIDSTASLGAMTRAASDFRLAHDRASAWWTAPARLVPIAGQHVAVVAEAAGAGVELAEAAVTAAEDADVDSIRIRGGAVDLDAVAALHPPLETAAAATSRARSDLETRDSPWLLPPVAGRLDEQLARLRRAERDAARAAQVVAHVPAILGRDRPRRYFVAVQTPAELRASGGFIGNYGELLVDDGRMELVEFGRTRDLNLASEERELVAPPDYLTRYERFQPDELWQNVTMSPDFPTVAEVVADLYPKSGGSPVDGVIAVDPVSLAALVGLVGPIEVVPWPEPLTGDNTANVLLVDQYVQLEGEARVDFLGDVAEQVIRLVTSEDLPAPRHLFDLFGPVVTGKHLQFTTVHEDEASTLRRLGVAGGLDTTGGDSLAVINQNASGNKIDTFLRRSIAYRAEVDVTTGALDATVDVELTNEAPTEGLPDYIIGSGGGLSDPPGSNRTYLSIYSPWHVESAEVNGDRVLVESERERGRNVYSMYLVLPPGDTTTVSLDLRGLYPVDAGYRLALHRQPTAHPDSLRTEVVLRSGAHRLARRAAAPSDFTSDRLVTVPADAFRS